MEPWEQRMQEQRDFEAALLANVQARNPQMLQFAGPGRPAVQTTQLYPAELRQQQEPDLATQLQRVKLTQAERMRLAKMYHGRALVQEGIQSGEFDPEDAQVLMRGIQFGIQPYQLRLQQEQLLSSRLRNKTEMEAYAQQTAIANMNAASFAANAQKRMYKIKGPDGLQRSYRINEKGVGEHMPELDEKPPKEEDENFDELKAQKESEAFATVHGYLVEREEEDEKGNKRKRMVPDPVVVRQRFREKQRIFQDRLDRRRAAQQPGQAVQPGEPAPAPTGPMQGPPRPNLADVLAEAIRSYKPRGIQGPTPIKSQALGRLDTGPAPKPVEPKPVEQPKAEAKPRPQPVDPIKTPREFQAVMGPINEMRSRVDTTILYPYGLEANEGIDKVAVVKAHRSEVRALIDRWEAIAKKYGVSGEEAMSKDDLEEKRRIRAKLAQIEAIYKPRK